MKRVVDVNRKGVRQGDVLVVPILRLPTDARAMNTHGRHILAEGEKTGHHHSIAAGPHVAFLASGARRFLDVRARVALEHQEHDPLPIDPGSYEVRLQRQASVTQVAPVFD
jgi:hypothetical protein